MESRHRLAVLAAAARRAAGRPPRPAAVCLLLATALAAPVGGQTYYTEDQALRLAFPDADAIDKVVTRTTPEQQERIKALGQKTAARVYTYHVGKRQGRVLGYAVIDDARGQYQPITYMLAVTPECAVSLVEILVYRESHGGEVRQPKFRAQFKGKTAADPVRLRSDIKNISGATISCRSIADGVRKNLAHLSVIAAAATPNATGAEISPATGAP